MENLRFTMGAINPEGNPFGKLTLKVRSLIKNNDILMLNFSFAFLDVCAYYHEYDQ